MMMPEGAPNPQIRRMTAAEAARLAFDEQQRLNDQDRVVISLLAEHGVLTARQITALAGYTSLSVAQHRLKTLTDRGIFARFRGHVWAGSQAWRYVLGVLGATLHASATGETAPTPSRVVERALALAESPRLNHTLAVGDVFASLAGYARTHRGCALVEGWSERRATDECLGLARPDGAGVWAERGRQLPFWLELDRGTEKLSQLTDKLIGYRQLVDLGWSRPVLIVVPSTVRERHLHQQPGLYLTGPDELVVATTTADHITAAGQHHATQHTIRRPSGLSLADAVWLPAGARRRVRLIDIGDWPWTPQ
jgi:hypothetical protein